MYATRESIDAALEAEGAEYGEEYLKDEPISYSYQPIDKFKPKEEANISSKLVEFADALKKLEVGNQIIYGLILMK